MLGSLVGIQAGVQQKKKKVKPYITVKKLKERTAILKMLKLKIFDSVITGLFHKGMLKHLSFARTLYWTLLIFLFKI